MRAIKLVDVKEAIANGVTPEIFAKEHGVSLDYTRDLFELVKNDKIKGEYIVLPLR